MAISLKSLTRKAEIKPPRILVYGVEGIGKTTFAAYAPSPVFICTEDGRGVLEVDSFPLMKSFDEVMETIGVLYTEKHEFNTAVIDTVDWLETLIWKKVCDEHSVMSIADIDFGKGYAGALVHWNAYLAGLDALRNDRGMAIVQIAHSQIERFDSPETEPYDRYTVKLHKSASAKVREFSDVVAFANYKVQIAKTDVGFNKKVTRAVGGERLLYLSEKPAYQAKNRYAMPDDCMLDWNDFAQHLPGGEPAEEATEETQEAEQQAQEPKKKEKAA